MLDHDRKTRQRNYRTLLTFMSRMAKKGWLEVEKEGRTNFYTPALTEADGLKREIRHFFDDIVGNAPEHLLLVEEALESAKKRRLARR